MMVILRRLTSPLPRMMLNIFIFIRLLFLAFLAEFALPMEVEEFKLAQHVLKTYNTIVRPAKNHRDTTTVQMSIKLVNLIDMDEVNQIMTTSVVLTEIWNDDFLIWDPSDWFGIEFLTLPITDIWTPDIVLYNNANDNLNSLIRDTRCIVHHEGVVTWNAPAILMSACEMNPMFFPFDVQNCSLKFGSWTYHGIQLNLTLNEEEATSEFVTTGEWDLVKIPAGREVNYYNCCAEPYPTVTYNVVLARRSLFYMCNLVLPCVIIASIVLQGFYLPSDAGEKVALTITILLSLTVFLLMVADTMPPTSDVLPYLSIYYAVIIVLVGFCASMTVVIINIHHRGDSTKVPKWLHSLVLVRLASILRLRNNISLSSRQMEIDYKDGANMTLQPPIGVLNPIFEGDDAIEDIMDGNEPDKAVTLRERQMQDSLIEQYMEKIAKNITCISKRQMDESASNTCSQEWRELAMVLDRFLMLIFLFMSVFVTTMTLLMAAYHVEVK